MGWGHKSIEKCIQAWFEEYEVWNHISLRCHFLISYNLDQQDYVEKGVDPLIYRDSSDPEVQRHGLGQIGHFTAMVNANSTKIGCAKVHSQKFPYRVIYGCNYQPSGNIIMKTSKGLVPLPAYHVATGTSVKVKEISFVDSDFRFIKVKPMLNLSNIFRTSQIRS